MGFTFFIVVNIFHFSNFEVGAACADYSAPSCSGVCCGPSETASIIHTPAFCSALRVPGRSTWRRSICEEFGL